MEVDILEKYNQTNQFGNFLDLKIKILKPGDVKYTVSVKEHHLATVKSAHGGFISAIFDIWRWNQNIDPALKNNVEFVSKVPELKNFITGVEMLPLKGLDDIWEVLSLNVSFLEKFNFLHVNHQVLDF